MRTSEREINKVRHRKRERDRERERAREGGRSLRSCIPLHGCDELCAAKMSPISIVLPLELLLSSGDTPSEAATVYQRMKDAGQGGREGGRDGDRKSVV